jgi:hypothetical protein
MIGMDQPRAVKIIFESQSQIIIVKIGMPSFG